MCAVVYAFTSKIHSENNSMNGARRKNKSRRKNNMTKYFLYNLCVCDREWEKGEVGPDAGVTGRIKEVRDDVGCKDAHISKTWGGKPSELLLPHKYKFCWTKKVFYLIDQQTLRPKVNFLDYF